MAYVFLVKCPRSTSSVILNQLFSVICVFVVGKVNRVNLSLSGFVGMWPLPPKGSRIGSTVCNDDVLKTVKYYR